MAIARRTTYRSRGRRRLPRLPLGTAAITVILFIAAARTWPIPAAILTGVTAAALVARVALRPRRRPAQRPRLAQRRPPALRVRSPRRGPRTLAGYQAMSPDQFEHAIADLARQDPNVRSATAQGGSGDRGLDVLIRLHDGRRILIQCKRYADGNNVGGPVVLHTFGAVRSHNCTAGVIVTTASFTREALATNTSLGPDRLALVDGSALVAWANGGPAPWAVTLRSH